MFKIFVRTGEQEICWEVSKKQAESDQNTPSQDRSNNTGIWLNPQTMRENHLIVGRATHHLIVGRATHHLIVGRATRRKTQEDADKEQLYLVCVLRKKGNNTKKRLKDEDILPAHPSPVDVEHWDVFPKVPLVSTVRKKDTMCHRVRIPPVAGCGPGSRPALLRVCAHTAWCLCLFFLSVVSSCTHRVVPVCFPLTCSCRGKRGSSFVFLWIIHRLLLFQTLFSSIPSFTLFSSTLFSSFIR